MDSKLLETTISQIVSTVRAVVVAGMLLSQAIATAQIPATSYQTGKASGLWYNDAFVNMTNNSASTLCVNTYVFANDLSFASCCARQVAAGGKSTFSARNDLISNTLTATVPSSISVN